MTKRVIRTILRKWRFYLLLLCCAGLLSCSKPLCLQQKIDVSRAGETVKFTFEIRKEWTYQFAFLFATGEGYEEIERRFRFFGELEGGVIIPVSLTLIKDGDIFLDEQLDTVGTGWGQTVFFEDRKINTAVRNIKILTLPVGKYSAVLKIQADVADFKGVESFAELSFYNPKI